MKTRFSSIFINVATACLLTNLAAAQVETSDFTSYISQIREGHSPSLPYALLKDNGEFDRLLPVVKQSLSDTVVAVRSAGHKALHVMQQNAVSSTRKSTLLTSQLKGLEDVSPEIVGLTISHLNQVSPALFSSSQKDLLVNKLRSDIPGKETLVRMMGFFGLTQAIPDLRFLTQPGNSQKLRWAAYLALSRLEDEAATSFIYKRLMSFEVSDDFVYELVPDIIYTRQKQLYDYLVELLYSNERNCEPADPDQTTSINCAYRILEALAPEIAEFPISTSASGDLETNNYLEALQTARDWFRGNRDYEIKSG